MSFFEKRMNCPLRDMLADFFVRELSMAPNDATLQANNFMRSYLESADRVLLGRVEAKTDGRRRRNWAR